MFRNRSLSILLTFALLLLLCACHKEVEPGTLPVPAETSTEAPLPTETDASGEPVTAPTTKATTPARTKAPTTTAPTTEAPLADYPFEPTSTGIFVTRDGDIFSAEITPFDNKNFDTARYDEAGLKRFINQQIKDFNEVKKSEVVKLEELTVEEGEARLLLSYSNFNYFLEFQGADFDVKHLALMSRENAVKNYNITNLVDTSGKATPLLTALESEKVKVLIITGKTHITVNGDILYISDGMTLTGINMVRCNDDEHYSFVVFR